ncbi:uncharacterized protein LOC143341179 [Colletes latitarsis]|uniref:uncharacterized protein LOC143341175 n=1 Tax=Colletes latitarsis TaxID=2605962 RepID=UPI00403616A6
MFRKVISDSSSLLIEINPTNLNPALEHLSEVIIAAASAAIPKTKNKTNANAKYNPWWNEKCPQAVKDCKHAFNRYKKQKTAENLINFKKYRAISRKITKDSKRRSWINYTSTLNAHTPPSAIWKKIRAIKGSNQHSSIPALNKEDNSISTDPNEISEILVTTFQKNSSDCNHSKQFQNYKQKTDSNASKSPIIDQESPYSSNLNSPIQFDELLYFLNKCSNTSPGPDGIPNIFLTHLPQEALNYMLAIFNCIWSHNIFPTKWREAVVIPVLKPGKTPTDPNSYRPIALTNTMCKLMEKIINYRLRWYLESRHLIAKQQSGFRLFHSTYDHLINLETNVCDAFANNQYVTAVCLDIEKAYDMVWRNRILRILQNFGLYGNILNFISNFLSIRTIQVRANNVLSTTKILENGVPQGSVLSVSLFLIAINDILDNIPIPVKGLLFADDLTLLCKGRNLHTIQIQLQEALDKLQKWSLSTGFKFSSTKSKTITFSRKKQYSNIKLTLDNLTIKETSSIKILGLTFDSQLTWTPHINKLKTDCYHRLNILRTIAAKNWGADLKTLLLTYKTIVRSKMDYGSIIYNSANNNILKKLDPVHNNALRITVGAFRSSPINGILNEVSEPPLQIRRKYLSTKFAVRIAAHPQNPVFHNVFRNNNLNHLHQRKRTPHPLCYRISNYLKELGMEIQLSSIRSIPSIPPWTFPRINTNTSLLKYSQKKSDPIMLKAMFQELEAGLANHVHIYTDGSKTPIGSGYAIVRNQLIEKVKLHHKTPIFLCELQAIKHAIKSTLTDHNTNFAIFCDSTSAISALQKLWTSDPVTQECQEAYTRSSQKNNSITIIWIPSHIGITGNEKADRAAKEAANSTPNHHDNSTHLETLLSTLKDKIKDSWNKEWSALAKPRTKLIKNNFFEKSITWKLPRPDQVIVSRIIIGHTKLTHQHLLHKADPPICETCKDLLTIEHIIIHCRKYIPIRQRHNIKPTLKDNLKDNTSAQNLLQYHKMTKLYNKL